jgi:signal transduction histidine kinase
MRISTKGRIATVTALATLVLLAMAICWADGEVAQARRQRDRADDITQGLIQLQQVAFEYMLHRQERALVQVRGVSQRLAQVMVDDGTFDSEAALLLDRVRQRNALMHGVFTELGTAADVGPSMVAPSPESVRRFSDQLSNQLLALQQENLVDAVRLDGHATERIDATQRRVLLVMLAGLLPIALNTAAAAWLVNRTLLVPIKRLGHATREVALGNWGFRLNEVGQDEVGELSRKFNAMMGSLQDSFAQVERNNRELAALNQEVESFSYSVSHDLRGPLRSMDGFSLALLEDYGDKLDAEGQDALRRIRAACQRMGQLIDDLLGLSRVTRAELTLQPVDLSDMARQIAKALTQQHPGRSVEWFIEDGIVVQADRALMQIALQNLIENAWKFTSKTRQPIVRVGVERRDGRLDCFVADNGVGFDMAHADKLFGAFQRLHHESEFPGTGIGLATVQRIFMRHAARLRVEAKLGVGATFFFSMKGPGDDD